MLPHECEGIFSIKNMRIDLNYMAKIKEKALPRLIYVRHNSITLNSSLMQNVPTGYKRIAFETQGEGKDILLYLVFTNASDGFLIHDKKGNTGYVTCKGLGSLLCEKLGVTLLKSGRIIFIVGSESMMVEGKYSETWYEIIKKPLEK